MADARAELRREQVRILLVAVPVLVATYFLVGRVGAVSDQRLIAVVVLLPLLAVLVALGIPLVRDRRLVLGGGFLWFFVVYCLFFSIAAGTHVLEGKRTVVPGFEDATPSNVLGLSRLGDWHYAVAPSAPAANDLLVITLPSFGGRTVDEARQAEIGLIANAVGQHAKGIAFDYDMSDSSRMDRALCFWIQRAESLGVAVVLGYVLDRTNDSFVRRMPSPVLAACVPNERLGTLAGVREADGRVRMVPTSHLGNDALRSFSYRIASVLTGGKPLPDVGLTQFVAPATPVATLSSMPNDTTVRLMRDRFVIVGSERLGDVHATPYGPLPGVMIHAYAANALRTDHVIQRLPVQWVLPAILLVCYVLVLLQSHGGLRPLLIGAALIAVAVVLSAIFAMRSRLLWIDLSYPLIAVAGLTAVLAGGARLRWARVRQPRAAVAPLAAGMPNAEPVGRFDVFLSHNSADKPTVIELATILRDRQLKVWLDVWELIPGRPWQEALEQIIETAGSAAVLVGRDGIGPWEAPEMRACLDECVRRQMSVIPVLLPGASATPALPLFLRRFTWVDLRKGLDDGSVDRLEWGITGIKPRRTPTDERRGTLAALSILILALSLARVGWSQPRAATPVSQALTAFDRAKAETMLRRQLPCLGCHSLQGEGGKLAPDLATVRDRRDADYIARIVADPSGTIPGTFMPHTPMPMASRTLVVRYLGGNTALLDAPRAGAVAGVVDSSGPALYSRFCTGCHGIRGAGDGPNAAALPVPPARHASREAMSARSDDDLYDTIAGGGAIMNRSPRMPAYGTTLTPAQIRALVRHIRTLCQCTGPTWSTDGAGVPK